MRRNARVVGAGLATLLGVIASQGHLRSQEASGPGPEVVIRVTVLKEVVVTQEDGTEKATLMEVTATSPGDTLVYRIEYANLGDEAAKKPRIVDPIPPGTALLPGNWSADGTDLTVSADGGETFESYPIRRQVTLADGTRVQKEIDHELYTHLQWAVREPLLPGMRGYTTFKVLVR